MDSLFKRNNQVYAERTVCDLVQCEVEQRLAMQPLRWLKTILVNRMINLHKPIHPTSFLTLDPVSSVGMPPPVRNIPTQTRQHTRESKSITSHNCTQRPQNDIPEYRRSGFDADTEDDIHRILVALRLAAKLRRLHPDIDVQSEENRQSQELDCGEKIQSPWAESCIPTFAYHIHAKYGEKVHNAYRVEEC
jgi:hypothetical protein